MYVVKLVSIFEHPSIIYASGSVIKHGHVNHIKLLTFDKDGMICLRITTFKFDVIYKYQIPFF